MLRFCRLLYLSINRLPSGWNHKNSITFGEQCSVLTTLAPLLMSSSRWNFNKLIFWPRRDEAHVLHKVFQSGLDAEAALHRHQKKRRWNSSGTPVTLTPHSPVAIRAVFANSDPQLTHFFQRNKVSAPTNLEGAQAAGHLLLQLYIRIGFHKPENHQASFRHTTYHQTNEHLRTEQYCKVLIAGTQFLLSFPCSHQART